MSKLNFFGITPKYKKIYLKSLTVNNKIVYLSPKQYTVWIGNARKNYLCNCCKNDININTEYFSFKRMTFCSSFCTRLYIKKIKEEQVI